MSFQWTPREGISYKYTYESSLQAVAAPVVLSSTLDSDGLLVLQFDITFPAMPCEWISLDLMDISGELHLDVVSLCGACPPACNFCVLCVHPCEGMQG